MAVTLSCVELSAALKIGDSAEETADAMRLLKYVREAITRHAPNAPDAVQDVSAIRLAGHLYDSPTAARGTAYANALRNSGAAAILAPWRDHRAGVMS